MCRAASLRVTLDAYPQGYFLFLWCFSSTNYVIKYVFSDIVKELTFQKEDFLLL